MERILVTFQRTDNQNWTHDWAFRKRQGLGTNFDFAELY